MPAAQRGRGSDQPKERPKRTAVLRPSAANPERPRRSGARGTRPAADRRPTAPVSVDLTVDLGRGLVLPNPILVASGTFGYGVEYGDVVDVDRLGAICCKGTTLKARIGNPTPRVTETPGGMLNSIGLQNPGVDAVIEKYAATLGELEGARHRQRGGRIGGRLRRGHAPTRGRAGDRRHRAQHLLPECRQGRAPVRDRRRGRGRGHRRRAARHGPAPAREALAQRRRHPTDRASHRRRRRRRADRHQHAVRDRRGTGSRQAATRQHLRRPVRPGREAGRAPRRVRGGPGGADPGRRHRRCHRSRGRARLPGGRRRCRPGRDRHLRGPHACRSVSWTSSRRNAGARASATYRDLIGTALPRKAGPASAKGVEYRP